jgi:anti-sigma regulatory factor (Ser/Thr protein kinase)
MERTIRATATTDRLPELIAFLQAFWQEFGLPEEAAFPFELALDEVFMNVVMHGSSPSAPPREVQVSLDRRGRDVTLVTEDDGPPFDPLTLPRPDVDAPLEEREIGGLGVFLIRELMDEVTYAHTGTHNRLTMRKTVT